MTLKEWGYQKSALRKQVNAAYRRHDNKEVIRLNGLISQHDAIRPAIEAETVVVKEAHRLRADEKERWREIKRRERAVAQREAQIARVVPTLDRRERDIHYFDQLMREGRAVNL